MTDLTWVRGDNVQISITIGDTHTVDREGIHNTAFGPEAAEDPQTGIEVRTDGKIAIGHRACPALAFARAQSRISLLHRLLDGVELSDAKFGSIYRARGTTRKKGYGSVVVRLSDLFWRSGSGELWVDFPSLLEERFDLNRRMAWRLAWVLVRAAYSGRWPTVEMLIKRASAAAEKPGPNGSEVSGVPASVLFEGVVDAAIADLKGQVLT